MGSIIVAYLVGILTGFALAFAIGKHYADKRDEDNKDSD